MVQSEFQQAAIRVAREIDNRQRQSRFAPQWQLLADLIRSDLPAATDELYAAWSDDDLPTGFRAFLQRTETVRASGDDAPSWQLTLEDSEYLRLDCLAVACHRIYRLLRAASNELLRQVVAGASGALDDLITTELRQAWQVLAAVLPNDEEAIQAFFDWAWRIETPEYRALSKQVGRIIASLRGITNPTGPAVATFTLLILMVEEEATRSLEPVWALAAGRKGGVGQVEVATLDPNPQAPQPVELAPWSRYRISTASLRRVASGITDLARLDPGTRYRIAFNPPGVSPAQPGHIQATNPSGESITLALALAAYAAGVNASLGRYAVTGEVSADLRLLAVEEVPDKLAKLAFFNEMSAQPVADVLLPERNLTPEVIGRAGDLGLRLNQGLRGSLKGIDLQAILQPGILFDCLHEYTSRLTSNFAAIHARHTPAHELAAVRGLANSLLADVVQATRPAGTADAPRAFILPAPATIRTADLIAYLASELAQRRSQWAQSLGQVATTNMASAKPPAPVVLDASMLQQGLAQAVGAEIVRVTGSADLSSYANDAWHSVRNEFILLLSGDDDLVKRHIVAHGGFLDEVLGHGGRAAGKQLVILIPAGLEQMWLWARDLERADELLQPAPKDWYPKAQQNS